MPKVIYTALFVDNPEELMRKVSPVFEKTYYHHSTIEYKPKNWDYLEVGRKVVLKVFGRVVGEELDVLLVEGNDKCKGKYPHITLSMLEGVKPNDSKDAIGDAYRDGTVQMLEELFEVETTEGYFDGEKVVTG